MSELNLEQDVRKDRILDAALKEFASKGYYKASTNAIVKEANVSKGLLFHYFQSKKVLFITIYRRSYEMILNEIFDHVNFSNRDVLWRLEVSTIERVNAHRKYELLTRFFITNEQINRDGIKEDIDIIKKEYVQKFYEKMFYDIDYYLFKEHLNLNDALQVIRYTIDRILADYEDKYNHVVDCANLERLSKHLHHYITFFKDAFYR
ncbi:MAG: TetR/AcrR family transcriptional regulator [Candidatus Izemoplasmataceae bacterium]